MAINKHDDYEALAKLLYPSIEASGNVYYGQTRKLTLDEVLKRNSLGFDSHIESFYNESDGRYDSYFCWRLGSLHGSICVDQDHIVDGVTASDFNVPFIKRILYADSEEIIYDDKLIYYMAKPNEGYALDTSMVPIFGTIFAKYRLDKHSTAITNELHSGSYDSYEVDVEPVLDGIYVTDDFNPVNSIDDDISERHFYISKEKGTDYLYIQILTNEDTSKILTFTALEDSEISLSMVQPTNGTQRSAFYRVSQDDGSFPDNWEGYHYDWEVTVTPSGPISLNTGRKIQFKSHIANIEHLPNNADDCLKFVINSGTLFVSGSCISMCNPDTDESMIDTLKDYALYGLFSNVKNMYGTPVLPNVNKLGSGCYESMFMNCTSLTVAPKIKSSDTYSYISENDNYCYHNMFCGCVSLVSPPKVIGYYDLDKYYHSGVGTCDSMFIGCSSLKLSPVIRYKTLGSYSCHNMFYGCSSLKVIRCGAKYIDESSATQSWVYGVSKNGVFIKSTANYTSGTSGIPEGWAVVTKDDDYFAVHKEPDHGFRIDKHTPSDNYKNDYLVTSGTDSSTNGRGYIANTFNKESTIGKMERSFDENNTHPMNTYNTDGSFNQEIWGYKSFNSPVKFRNGVYGECASLTTLDSTENFNFNIRNFKVYGDSVHRDKNGDRPIDADIRNGSELSSYGIAYDTNANVEVVTAINYKYDAKVSHVGIFTCNDLKDNASKPLYSDVTTPKCACVRACSFDSISEHEYGIYDELDGWTISTRDTNVDGNVYIASVSANNAYMSVRSVVSNNNNINNSASSTLVTLNDGSNTESKIDLKADRIVVDGFLDYGIIKSPYDSKLPIGMITFLAISENEPGTINNYYYHFMGSVIKFTHEDTSTSLKMYRFVKSGNQRWGDDYYDLEVYMEFSGVSATVCGIDGGTISNNIDVFDCYYSVLSPVSTISNTPVVLVKRIK